MDKKGLRYCLQVQSGTLLGITSFQMDTHSHFGLALLPSHV